MEQTAAEWLVKHWKKLQSKGEKMTWQQVIDITEIAKQMEKQQIIKGYEQRRRILQPDEDGIMKFMSGEQYYNETYGGKDL